MRQDVRIENLDESEGLQLTSILTMLNQDESTAAADEERERFSGNPGDVFGRVVRVAIKLASLGEDSKYIIAGKSFIMQIFSTVQLKLNLIV